MQRGTLSPLASKLQVRTYTWHIHGLLEHIHGLYTLCDTSQGNTHVYMDVCVFLSMSICSLDSCMHVSRMYVCLSCV